MSSIESIQRLPNNRLILAGECQSFLRRRRSSNSVRLSSLFLYYTLIISLLDMNPGIDLLSEYLPLIYQFFVEIFGDAHDLSIVYFSCRYIYMTILSTWDKWPNILSLHLAAQSRLEPIFVSKNGNNICLYYLPQCEAPDKRLELA
jgi:hypothetical protein